MRTRSCVVAGAALLMSLLGGGSVEADIYLTTQVPTIQGEATTVGFENSIEVLAASFGGYNPACSGGKGQVTLSEFSFTKYVDRATVDFFAAMRDHTVFGEFAFRFTKSTGQGLVVYQAYRFHNAVLSAGSSSGSAADPGVESWSLSFSDVEIDYTYIDGAGKVGGTETVTITPAACPGG